MTATSAVAIARELLRAQDDRHPGRPVRELVLDLAREERLTPTEAAYAVQQVVVQERVGRGARRVGRKIGLTSAAVQQQLGVSEPDFGVLLDQMRHAPDTPIALSGLLQPRVEAEVAFVLSRDLTAANCTAAEARAAVAGAAPALEIVDSRICDWEITFVDTVADNASSGAFVLGAVKPLGDLVTAEITMQLRRDDKDVSQGSGRDCLGDPLAALAWLARTAVALGDPLRADEIVLSGALGPMVPVAAGDRFHADVSGLGPVSTSFE